MAQGPHDGIRKAESARELEDFRDRLRATSGGGKEPLRYQVIKHNRNVGQPDTVPKRLFKANNESVWIISGVSGIDPYEYRFPEDADSRLEGSGVDVGPLSGKPLSAIPKNARTKELVETIRKRLQGQFRFGCVRSDWDNVWPPDQTEFDFE